MAQDVVDQVFEHALDQAEVTDDEGQCRDEVAVGVDAGLGSLQGEALQIVLDQFGDRQRLALDQGRRRFEAGELEQLAYPPSETLGLVQRPRQVGVALRRVEGGALGAERFEVAPERSERRAQIVGEVGDQLTAMTLEALTLGVLVLDAPLQMGERGLEVAGAAPRARRCPCRLR